MKSAVKRIVCVSALVLGVAATGAQERSAPASSQDPRVGLKAGLEDAGVAARNMVLVKNLPKPPGFFDPAAPAAATPRTRADTQTIRLTAGFISRAP